MGEVAVVALRTVKEGTSQLCCLLLQIGSRRYLVTRAEPHGCLTYRAWAFHYLAFGLSSEMIVGER